MPWTISTEVIAIIRSSKDRSTAKQRLSERFGLDDDQTQAIVQMTLGALTNTDRLKLEEELAAIEAKVADYRDILSNRTRLMGIIKDEALEIKRKYGDERRTEIATISGEVDIAAVPTNLASVLYNKTEGGVKLLALNTLGVLYMVTKNEEVASIADLKGKTIYATGAGFYSPIRAGVYSDPKTGWTPNGRQYRL